MAEQNVIFIMFLIFSGAAVLSTVALLTRQSLLVAYMLLGIVLGPWVLNWVGDLAGIQRVGGIGILFLLFLLGLHLPPQKLSNILKEVSVVGVISSVVFAGLGYIIGVSFGFSFIESIVIGAAMMFSSTIIGIKLLPTTVLHHQHTGELMIGVLLFQDLLAIVVLLLLRVKTMDGSLTHDLLLVFIGFPGILLLAFLFEKFVLMHLLQRFSRIKEYVFLIAIAWCLCLSELAFYFGLSDEVGAFIAGVTLAASPVSVYIAESLKPIRDFFLVMFFFSVGASFNLQFLPQVILPACMLAVAAFGCKPLVYRYLLRQVSETSQVSWEVGFRLAQISEFSLIIAMLATESGLLSTKGMNLIQAATILSFMVSSYWIVMRYPTPVALSEEMRRD